MVGCLTIVSLGSGGISKLGSVSKSMEGANVKFPDGLTNRRLKDGIDAFTILEVDFSLGRVDIYIDGFRIDSQVNEIGRK